MKAQLLQLLPQFTEDQKVTQEELDADIAQALAEYRAIRRHNKSVNNRQTRRAAQRKEYKSG